MSGRTVAHPTSRTWLVRANNPSPMTLDGVNTWVLVEPGERQAVVVDPGPLDASHLDTVVATVSAAGARGVGLVLLTHGHADHAESADGFAARVNAPVRAAAAALCSIGEQPLSGGELLRLGQLQIEVLATPGHTADSVCFVVGADAALLTGDTVLGQGSTVVAWPDGRLDDYLASLRALRTIAGERRLGVVLPGHGPAVDDPAALFERYLEHRERRLAQVRVAAATAGSVDEVLHAVYGDVEPALKFAARWSLLAQLDYLRDAGCTVPEAGDPAG
jgi:glyoxylase-like metal-dependent hydrolase (beta-lactamase superfamily II)